MSAGLENDEEKSQIGGQPGNLNAFKHGEYSELPLPEEELIYKKKRKIFTDQIGICDPFDDYVIHILSLISARFDVAMSKNAPVDSLIALSSEILRLLKCLKETRDTRDLSALNHRLPADFIDEIKREDEESGFFQKMENQRALIYDFEKEVNRLRQKLDLPFLEEVNQRTDACPHCKLVSEHRKNKVGEWVCLNCGWVEEVS